MLTAKDVMTAKVTTLDPDLSADEAAERLLKARIGGAPVVGRDGTLLGIVSRSDLLRRRAEARPPAFHIGEEIEVRGPIRPDAAAETVADVMTKIALTAAPETPVAQLAGFMRARQVHRVPVVRGRELLGIVTTMDLLKALADTRSAPRSRKASRTASRQGSPRDLRSGRRRSSSRS